MSKLTLTVKAAAEQLGLSQTAIYEAIRCHQIECIRFGERRIRIAQTEIDRLTGKNGQQEASVADPAIAGQLAEVRRILAQATEALIDLEVRCRASMPEEAA